VIGPTSSTTTPHRQFPDTSVRPPISIPTKQFHPAVELRMTDVAGIADLPLIVGISYDKFDADYESDV